MRLRIQMPASTDHDTLNSFLATLTSLDAKIEQQDRTVNQVCEASPLSHPYHPNKTHDWCFFLAIFIESMLVSEFSPKINPVDLAILDWLSFGGVYSL